MRRPAPSPLVGMIAPAVMGRAGEEGEKAKRKTRTRPGREMDTRFAALISVTNDDFRKWNFNTLRTGDKTAYAYEHAGLSAVFPPPLSSSFSCCTSCTFVYIYIL